MPNNFSNLTDAQLIAALTSMVNGLDGQTAIYGLTTADYTALESDAGQFNSSVESATLAEDARKAATANKRTRKSAAVTRLGNLAKRIYGNPAVTNEQLANVGLAPRSTGGTRQTPKTPLDFLALAGVEGQVNFKWKRNANPRTAIFVIQQWQSGSWATIALTNKLNVTLTGFPLNVTARFRVLAQVNQEASLPSNESVIWPSEEGAFTIAA